MTRERLGALLQDACPRYERVFLVFNRYGGYEQSWRRGYGDMVTDIALGRLASSPARFHEHVERLGRFEGICLAFSLECFESRARPRGGRLVLPLRDQRAQLIEGGDR